MTNPAWKFPFAKKGLNVFPRHWEVTCPVCKQGPWASAAERAAHLTGKVHQGKAKLLLADFLHERRILVREKAGRRPSKKQAAKIKIECLERSIALFAEVA